MLIFAREGCVWNLGGRKSHQSQVVIGECAMMIIRFQGGCSKFFTLFRFCSKMPSLFCETFGLQFCGGFRLYVVPCCTIHKGSHCLSPLVWDCLSVVILLGDVHPSCVPSRPSRSPDSTPRLKALPRKKTCASTSLRYFLCHLNGWVVVARTATAAPSPRLHLLKLKPPSGPSHAHAGISGG